MASGLDWSVAALPGYMAAKQLKEGYSNAVKTVGMLSSETFGRKDINTQDLNEAIRGFGRSYYKDSVDHDKFKNYESWAASPEAANILQAAEGGVNMRNMGSDGFQIEMPDGTYQKISGSSEEGGIQDIYYGKDNVNAFQSALQNEFMTPEWQGGAYNYRTNRSALGAFFSTEKLRPKSNDLDYANPLMSYMMKNSKYGTGGNVTPVSPPTQKGKNNNSSNNSGSWKPNYKNSTGRGNKLQQNRNR
tara:strand:+ start:94 stop:831 length:738 start_codon:yes stop_codon:yes gene_type:complete